MPLAEGGLVAAVALETGGPAIDDGGGSGGGSLEEEEEENLPSAVAAPPTPVGFLKSVCMYTYVHT